MSSGGEKSYETESVAGRLDSPGPAPITRSRMNLPLFAATLLFFIVLETTLSIGWMSFRATLPDGYFALAVAVNLAMLGITALVASPAVLFLIRRWRRTRELPPSTSAVLAGLVAACLPLWMLNAGYGEGSFNRMMTPAIMGLWPQLVRFALYLAGVLLLCRLLPARRLLQSLLIGSCLLLLILGGATLQKQAALDRIARLDLPASARERPHVFLILVDTLRADHLSLYGYDKPTSPHLDAFSQEAVIFERAIAPASWTRPSCASLLTGLYPPDLGRIQLDTPLPGDIPILPQFMKAEGYATAGIVASLHVSPIFGFQKGFDLLDNGATFLGNTGLQNVFHLLGLLEPRVGIYDAGELNERTFEWVRTHRNAEDPMFMYLHYTDPHSPYDPPAPFSWKDFADPEIQHLKGFPLGAGYGQHIEPDAARAMEAAYDAEIRYFDEMFGRLVEFLKAEGLYDQSLIIVTSDHGEEFNEHGGWAHARTLYKEVLHIPLLIRYPGGEQGGTRVMADASLVDLVPTIEDALGAQWNLTSRGVSLRQLDELRKPRWVYADTYNYRALYLTPHKLMQIVSGDDLDRLAAETYFDYVEDFPEMNPLEPETAMPEKELEAMRSVLHEVFAGARESESVEFSEETRRQLEGLGYL